jgi:tRNA 2-thiouridine synthesizing protein C
VSERYDLVVLSQSPYAGSGARAALDLALAFAVFGQAPRLLFQGEGVLQLRPAQDPSRAGRRSLRKLIDSLPLYDIEEIHVLESDAQRLGLHDTALPECARLVDDATARAMRAGARHILSL